MPSVRTASNRRTRFRALTVTGRRGIAPSPNQSPPAHSPKAGSASIASEEGVIPRRWVPAKCAALPTAIETQPKASSDVDHSPALQAMPSSTAVNASPPIVPSATSHSGGTAAWRVGRLNATTARPRTIAGHRRLIWYTASIVGGSGQPLERSSRPCRCPSRRTFQRLSARIAWISSRRVSASIAPGPIFRTTPTPSKTNVDGMPRSA